MTDHYGEGGKAPSSLDSSLFGASKRFVNKVDAPPHLAYASVMPVKDDIAKKLTAAFAPQVLDVIDESHQHAGHAGARPGGQTHFRVHIVAEAFRGKTRIERHRMINQTLSGELAGGVHALAIHASTPGEG